MRREVRPARWRADLFGAVGVLLSLATAATLVMAGVLLATSCVVVHVEPVRVERVVAPLTGSAAQPEPLLVDPCASITIGSTSAIDWRCMPGATSTLSTPADNMPGAPLGDAGSAR